MAGTLSCTGEDRCTVTPDAASTADITPGQRRDSLHSSRDEAMNISPPQSLSFFWEIQVLI